MNRLPFRTKLYFVSPDVARSRNQLGVVGSSRRFDRVPVQFLYFLHDFRHYESLQAAPLTGIGGGYSGSRCERLVKSVTLSTLI